VGEKARGRGSFAAPSWITPEGLGLSFELNYLLMRTELEDSTFYEGCLYIVCA
jgi:hypothetical protein